MASYSGCRGDSGKVVRPQETEVILGLTPPETSPPLAVFVCAPLLIAARVAAVPWAANAFDAFSASAWRKPSLDILDGQFKYAFPAGAPSKCGEKPQN